MAPSTLNLCGACSSCSDLPGTFDPSTSQQICPEPGARLGILTHSAYASGQNRFIEFCFQLGKIHLSFSPSPTDEWTLCWFSTSLGNAVRQTTMCFKRHWQIIGGRGLIRICQPEIVSCWPFLIPLIYHFWTFYFSFVNQTLVTYTVLVL